MFYQSNSKIFKIHDQTMSLKRLRGAEEITTKMSIDEVDKVSFAGEQNVAKFL